MPHVLLPLLLCALVFSTSAMHAMALHLLLLHAYFPYDEEVERIIQNLLPDSRPLGALLLRLRPSRQLRDLQPIPTLFWCFGCGDLWPFCPESLHKKYWWYFPELSQQDRHLRELLQLVDQGVGEFLLREVQAELVRTSRNISDLRRRVTFQERATFCATDPCRATSQPCPTLIMDLPKGKGRGKS